MNPMLQPLWHIPLKRQWYLYPCAGEMVPIVEAGGVRLVAGVFIGGDKNGYARALATARAVVITHNKAVRSARKEIYDEKKAD